MGDWTFDYDLQAFSNQSNLSVIHFGNLILRTIDEIKEIAKFAVNDTKEISAREFIVCYPLCKKDELQVYFI